MKPVIVAICGVFVGSLTSSAGVAPLPVRATSADEYFPAGNDGALMWTQSSPRTFRPTVYVRLPSGARIRVNQKGTTAFAVGISGHQALYRQLTPRIRGWTAFRLYNLASHRRRTLHVFPRQGVAVEGAFANGRLLYGWNTQAGREGIELRTLSTGRDILLDRVFGPGQVVVGGINRNFAVWKKCVVTDCGIYLYHIVRRETVRLPNPTGRGQSAPSVLADATVYLVEGEAAGCPSPRESLVRYARDGSRAVIATLRPSVLILRTSATFVGNEPTVYFDRGTCSEHRPTAAGLDIYKVVDLPKANGN